MKKTLAFMLTLVFSLSLFAGCSASQQTQATAAVNDGGTVVLSVNPEIAVSYDKDGKVTEIKAVNEDGKAILENIKNYIGKDCGTVVKELVEAIGNAGYFVEDVDGNSRKITLEIEKGSALPSKDFLDKMAEGIREYVSSQQWNSPVDVKGETDFDLSDYIETDYSDYGTTEATDYIETDYSDYGTTEATDYDETDYSDYGTTEATDYDETDYSDYGTTEATDYDESDYDETDYTAPTEAVKPTENVKPTEAKPVEKNTDYTDYDESDYVESDYDETDYTDYDETDYDESDYEESDYDETDYTDYDETDYDESDYR